MIDQSVPYAPSAVPSAAFGQVDDIDPVAAGTACDRVVAVTKHIGEQIRPIATDHVVVAGTAADHVVTGTAIEVVGSTLTDQDVVAAATGKHISLVATNHGVITACAIFTDSLVLAIKDIQRDGLGVGQAAAIGRRDIQRDALLGLIIDRRIILQFQQIVLAIGDNLEPLVGNGEGMGITNIRIDDRQLDQFHTGFVFRHVKTAFIIGMTMRFLIVIIMVMAFPYRRP